MRSVPKLARDGLLVCLALWIGFFSILQAVHLAFANHDHCFCPEHLRIEDVPRPPSFASRDVAASEGIERRFFSRSPSVSSNPADLLLSFSLQDSISKRIQPTWMPYDGGFQDLGSWSSEHVISFSCILIAPKTSPPSLATC